MSNPFPTVLTANALVISKTLDGYGINSRDILIQAGLDPAKLFDNNARFSYSAITKLWHLATNVTGDECFGIKVIEYWHPTNLHALGYAWLASTTLKEALQRSERYVRIVNSASTLTLTETNEGYEIIAFTEAAGTQPQPVVTNFDAGMALILHLCRLSTHKELMPVRMEIKRASPKCLERYFAYFGHNIQFNSHRNMLLIDKHTIEKRLPTANIELALSCDKIIKDYLARMDKSDIVMRVKSMLTDHLPSGNMTEQQIADTLNLSLRSMQRKLEEKGCSYKSLLEETRKELATQYIQNSNLSISEITYMLGFSEPSNFSRAFKRWTGKSPQAYRKVA